MQPPFGSSFKLILAPARSWLSLGPGWAGLAGVLASGIIPLNLAGLIQLLSLWLLVDPILGALWELVGVQGLWRTMLPGHLPSPPRHGFYLPYAQPGSIAGRLVVGIRRYGRWWQEQFWPEQGSHFAAVVLGAGLALLMSLAFGSTLFWLTLLALGLIVLAGQTQTDLAAAEGGRLQSVVQLLLPWVMGASLWSTLTPLSLALAVCYWVAYLGGLRMLGGHHRAELLFTLGQIAAIILLLGLRLLPGAAVLTALFVTQQIIKTKFNQPAEFLPKLQPYLVLSLLVGGWSLGSLLK
ncbi:MAG: hypothetical protein KJ077_26140 [Anaerolineae bacterium]|nr:hypothetical protein [Anaerolineae bacterium]